MPLNGIIEDSKLMKTKLGYCPNPGCNVCHGTGYLHPLMDGGRTDYSKVMYCDSPGCMRDSFNQYKSGGQYMKSKGVNVNKQTFENFKDRPGTRDAFMAMKSLADGNDKPFCLIYGGVGNGKTHLCQAAVRELLSRGIDTRYYTVADLIALLKIGIQDNTTDKTIRALEKYPGLVLDDWGVEYGTEWEQSKLEQIIDRRYQERLITVVTTNKEIDKLPERVISRFMDPGISQVALNEATDYRRR